MVPTKELKLESIRTLDNISKTKTHHLKHIEGKKHIRRRTAFWGSLPIRKKFNLRKMKPKPFYSDLAITQRLKKEKINGAMEKKQMVRVVRVQ